MAQLNNPLAEIDQQARRRPGSVQVALKHFSHVYYIIICHIGPLWGLLGTPGGPKMVQNITQRAQIGPTWPKMTLYGQNELNWH